MEITVSQEQGRVPITVFHIDGDIAADTSDQLEMKARQAIDSGTRYILFDLAQVHFISSYGIRSISQIFSWLRRLDEGEDDASLSAGLKSGSFKSCCLKLAAPTKHVREALSVAGIDMFLEIHNDLKQAVASF
jgi:anti-anti-sigma factor